VTLPLTLPSPLRHELSCRFLQPLLDLADEETLKGFLADWDVTIAQLRDQTNWVSLRFCEALVDALAAKIGADEVVERVTRAAFDPSALGFLYPLVRAFGTPQLGYLRLPQFVATLNKVSLVKVSKIRRGYAEVEYRPVSPEHIERSPLICQVRRAQIAAGPTIWGLPPAQVEERECQAQGGERCWYVLRWAERTSWWGLALGTSVGTGLGFAFGAGPWLPAAVVAGGALGRLWDNRLQVSELTRFNDEQTAALRQASEDAERRFVELERAKTEVDQKVTERTLELRQASTQLEASLERLEELARVKDEFVANVSHELRTPLTLILAPLEELLAGRAQGELSQDYLKAMHRSAVRLNGMVNDLLVLARVQAGQLRLSLEEIHVGELAASVLEQFRALAERKGIKLRYVGPPDGETVLAWLDPGRIEFVLVNLLSNAHKFTSQGGEVTLTVSKKPFDGHDEIVVEVRDTGAGIAPGLQDKVFERFSRFESSEMPGAAGAGIGLALVKELVGLHGGRVALSSAPGQGSTFTIAFRTGREHIQDRVLERRQVDVPVPFGRRRSDLEPVSETSTPSGGWADTATAPADAARVLVVEDNDDMRIFILRVLGPHYRLTQAVDGQDALELVGTERPDLIISDVMMPRLNGYELCRKLKADADTRMIPVLLLTAKKERALEGFEAGADDYLVKPFNSQELLARIDVHMRLRQLLRDRVHVEKLATLGALAAGLAHEVRNPAGAILAGLPKVRRSLSEVETPPRTLEMIDLAIDSAERITRLVDDLLQLGQPDRDGARAWDLHEGLDAALRILSQRAERVELRRRFDFHGLVRCRPNALNQVFLNLLDNAVRAVEKGGIVDVHTRAEAGGVSVLISDSGDGVPKELVSRIFEPFFTTRDTARGPNQGTGLGLHISQRVALEHGGRLELVDAKGWGACFKLWLPVTEDVSAQR